MACSWGGGANWLNGVLCAHPLLIIVSCSIAWNGFVQPPFDLANSKLYWKELSCVSRWAAKCPWPPLSEHCKPRFGPCACASLAHEFDLPTEALDSCKRVLWGRWGWMSVTSAYTITWASLSWLAIRGSVGCGGVSVLTSNVPWCDGNCGWR